MVKVRWYLAVLACLLCLVVAGRLPEETPGIGTPVKFFDADDIHESATGNKDIRFSGKKKGKKK
ncbi:MAG TPA: hypothetical protein P5077_00290 [bacterium]|nr:hypothetical protein [bacterium]